MSDIFADVVISMPSQMFTMARSFKAVANGRVYIGFPDTDPTIPSNQIQVYIEGESGDPVPVPQPISINAGGSPFIMVRLQSSSPPKTTAWLCMIHTMYSNIISLTF